MDHRKVIQYACNSSNADTYDKLGHGTLCASSLMGAPLWNISDPNSIITTDRATGMAPAARLSVVDFHRGNGQSLNVPEQVELDYLPVHAAVNATITSDSWGSIKGGYSIKARGYDMFLWKNPDVISFIAAGNSGLRAYDSNTLSTPSVAKNVMAVGAGYRIPASLDFKAAVYTVHWVKYGIPSDQPLVLKENANQPLLLSVLNDNLVEMVVADPWDACSPLNNADRIAGRIVLMTISYCSIYQKAQAVMDANGAAMIIIHDRSEQPSPPIAVDDDNQIVTFPFPMSTMFKEVGENLVMTINGPGGQLFISGREVNLDVNSLADFSSWGPTLDGRIKPDIIAPGLNIISAQITSANPDCEYRRAEVEASTTSRLTPAARPYVFLWRLSLLYVMARSCRTWRIKTSSRAGSVLFHHKAHTDHPYLSTNLLCRTAMQWATAW
ncbi:hypothetical protein Vafri_12282 [Volvox africanus]|uniref:Peptidase S8/S53 domain-containing protein n=1 Tax=Volvox africanus TaxID=51714 RepID=A0A8J4F1G4_9CHLO|nr:hypothetical protein Vafri_12282 [Volvox africanus]